MDTQPDTRISLQPLTGFDARPGPSTSSVHAGSRRKNPYHALIDPIVQTATYTFDDSEDLRQYNEAHRLKQQGERLDYGRYGNPTVAAAETRLAALEGAEQSLIVSTGMAAITTALLHLLPAGSHLILTDDCYRRTRQFCTEFLARQGVTCSIVPMGDEAALEKAVRPETRLLLSETPTNPYLRVLDLEKFAGVARRHGLISLVDTTFATPINIRPLDWGIDLVVHSATKYLGGHNDLLAGVISGRAELIEPLREFTGILGPVADPQNAYLLLRGLKTLGLRVERQNQSGQRVAVFLEGHSAIEQVWYPGLTSHPDYEIAARQMKGCGGVVSFTVAGDLDTTARFIDALQIPRISPSLGGVESLVNQPALISYYEYTSAQRRAMGISDNLVRLALGIEDADDLIADLDQALQTAVYACPTAREDAENNADEIFVDW